MNRMEKFEQIWSVRHEISAESLAQYRFESKEGYRLPGMAAHYRTYCDTLDSVVIELPAEWAPVCEADDGANEMRSHCIDAIESAGLRIAP